MFNYAVKVEMVEFVKRLEIIEGPRVRLIRLWLGLVALQGLGLGLVGVANLVG